MRKILTQQLQQLLQIHQRRNRYVGRAFGTDLLPAEAFILLMLEQRAASLGELASILRIPRSTVSRHVQGLVRRKLVLAATSEVDRRALNISLAGGGRKFLSEYHRRANAGMEGFLQHLSLDEAEELTQYDRRFADGLGVEEFNIAAAVHPLRNEIARHTIGLDLLSRGVFGAMDLSALEWHLLAELRAQPHGLRAQILRQRLDLTASLLSRAVRRLEALDLIESDRCRDDRRGKILSLSGRGLAQLEKLETQALQKIQSAVVDFTDAELSRFVELYAGFVGSGGALPAFSISLHSELRIERLVSEEERASARALLVTEAVLNGRTMDLPAVLYAERSWCFGLRRDGVLVGAFEIQEQPDGGSISNLVLCSHAAISRHLPHFLEFGMQQFCQESQIHELRAGVLLFYPEEVLAKLRAFEQL